MRMDVCGFDIDCCRPIRTVKNAKCSSRSASSSARVRYMCARVYVYVQNTYAYIYNSNPKPSNNPHSIKP